MKNLILILTLGIQVKANTEHIVEVSHDDEFFIISGQKFKAQTYCFSINEGDRVIFIEGSINSYGSKIYDLDTHTECELWGE